MRRQEKLVQALKMSPVLLAATIAGCNTTAADSETVETRALWVGVRFEASGNGATGVNVELKEGGRSGEDVRLSANERLEVNANGLIAILEEDQDLFDIDYEGSVPTDASGTLITLSLFRADGSVNSRTRANLPDFFAITSPMNDQAMTVGDVVDLRWSPATGGLIATSVLTQCSGTSHIEYRDVLDNGRYTINTGALPGLQDPAIVRENGCTLTIDLRRERSGTIDPAFRAGGFVTAVQERTIKLQLSF